MPKVCRNCGRNKDNPIIDPETRQRKRSREHQCDIAVVRDLVKSAHNEMIPYDVTVHSDRIEKGGDLYKKVTGKNPTHEVMFRSRTKIEKLAEKKGRKRTRKTKEKTMPAPSGEKLEVPK